MSKSCVFYHITQPLEKTLPRLVEKIYETKKKIVIFFDDEERCKAFNQVLWTFSTMAFLPHGCAFDSMDIVENCPIWLSVGFDDPIGADYAIMTYEEKVPLRYNHIVEFFHQDIDSARMRYKYYKDEGYEMSYWAQNSKGVWERK